ncbi:uncharacterized protein LOC123563762 [Mercenaria mercenaria]|uniref:uncharacterized protein LOC123563762 n=1 Tax=Mercenaria mercenaria TaxID=6596 RepID=UPI00234EF051|nr:uncharacterized protein LOC123563762 [Mercenaria mercenaria]
MLLYSDQDNGEEASCIKVPFIQRGNIHASNTLRKLYDVIFSNIVSTEELKHWQVYVTRCGDMPEGERVFLCITRYALIIVLNYHILHYHAYFSSEISVRCTPERNEIEFTVRDKAWVSDTNARENFSFFKTYVFKTTQCENVEKSFKNLMRKSLLYPQGPSAHFNIRHSEMSASAAPGTTSDNVMIIPHRTFWHDNNNSGSTSGSNGYLPSGKMDNIVTSHEPAPHFPDSELQAHRTASSNGSIPGFGNSAGVFVSHAEINRETVRPKDLTLHTRGVAGNVAESKVNEAVSVSDNAQVEDSKPLKTNPDTPNQHTSVKEIWDSDPGHLPVSPHGHGYLKKITGGGSLDELTPEELGFDNLSYYPDHEETMPSFATTDEADNLPPPPPCPSFSLPFVEVPHRPAPKPPLESLTEDELILPERQPNRGLLRSQSFLNLDEDRVLHMYANIAQEMSSRNSIHDDFPYYRFYYNIGLIRVMYARMSKKLKRRNRLSKEMKQIDFNKLEDHEQWYDRDFKIRSKDLKFCNLYNIPPETSKTPYDYTKLDGDDDPYWTQNDLCFTIQRILEESPDVHHLLKELQIELDIPGDQLMQLQVLLSLTPTENDWRVLAEYIGLSSSDITIIEHFCYTYRSLAANVVLTHWMLTERHHMLEHGQSTSNPPCNWDSLVQFLDAHGRDDITVILRSTRENEHVEEITHF